MQARDLCRRLPSIVPMQKRSLLCCVRVKGLCAIALLVLCGVAHAQRALPLEHIKLPPGFSIQVIARVPAAREMTFGAQGTLFVGSRSDKVYAVRLAPDDDPQKAQVHTIA